MSTIYEFLSSRSQNMVLTGTTGSTTSYQDFGGSDFYTISPELAGNVRVTDNDPSTVYLPPGLMVDAVRFGKNAVEFTVNGFTAAFLGSPADFTFVFAGNPWKTTAGVSASYAETAARFGTTVPETGLSAGTIVGRIQENGSISGGNSLIALADFEPGATVNAVEGTAEIFVLDFDSVNGTTALSAAGALASVSIVGFNPNEDLLRFDDASSPSVGRAAFLTLANVGENPFTSTTTIALLPAPGGDTGSIVTLVGIEDATLGGVNPFFEVV